jgi:hypothetical protein
VQFCLDHWNRLRAAIEQRGLGALVPDSDEKAMSNLQEELSGAPRTIDTYDPLMSAQWAIVTNLVSWFGLVALGEGCPLCHANEAHAMHCTDVNCAVIDPYDTFIERAVDDQVEVWKSFGE